MTFRRGLSQGLATALNQEYARPGSWWRVMADDPDLYVAVRDDYVNVYSKGQSLARICVESGELVSHTHYKYLLRPDKPSPYVRAVGGVVPTLQPGAYFQPTLCDARELVRAASVHASIEKCGVHEIIQSNTNIVDVEIALAAGGDDGARATAPRIDFAALRDVGGRLTLVFCEAKHFSNRELRAKKCPPVLAQIDRYSTLLAQHRTEVRTSYQRVFENLRDLDGIPADRKALAVSALTAGFEVSERPVLVVFGFDQDQRDGAVWRRHRQVLVDQLGDDRVLLRGDATGFCAGIA